MKTHNEIKTIVRKIKTGKAKRLALRMCAVLVAILVFSVSATDPVTAVAAERDPVAMSATEAAQISVPRMVLAGSTGVDQIDETFEKIKNIISGLCWFLGGIVAIIGLISIGISFSSHDPTQRMQGFLLLAGGAIIIFAPQILDILQKTSV